MDHKIVKATPEIASRLAPNLRDEDKAEVLAASNQTPLEALLDSMKRSTDCRALLINGEPAAMWGVAPLSEHVGGAWVLGSDALCQYRKTFLRLCRQELLKMTDVWPVLVNAIDARYTASIRWAKWLGFRVDEPKPFGAQGLPFCLITLWGKSHV